MIEIMVAIGIILVLMAIGVVGFRYLDKAGSAKATHVALSNCEAMVAEYEAAGMSIATLPNATNTSTPYYGDVAPGGAGRSNVIASTQSTFKVLLRVEKNKSMFSGLPAKAMADLNGTRQQVMADGWGNPIVFVGRGGLSTNLGKTSTGSSYSKTGAVITNPSGRPFWASAGPDGNFDSGDDNIYSFEK